MPHIMVKMYPGRSREIKEGYAKKLQELTVEMLGCPPEAVTVSMEDIPKEQWKEKVVENMAQEDMIIKRNV